MINRVANIQSVYWQSTDREREAGRRWYEEAHGVARVLATVARLEVRAAAGLLAALSPLNRWEDSVGDAFRMARRVDSTVRTTHGNRWKAVRILAGEDPDVVLTGPKVRAFWSGIADPQSSTRVAVDRHLYRAACGFEIPPHLADPKSLKEYQEIEHAYAVAAFGCFEPTVSVASTVWLVMRRLLPARGQMMFDL